MARGAGFSSHSDLNSVQGACHSFLDAFGGAFLLPVLPVLLGGAEPEGLASAAAWTALVVGVYYAGRSGILLAVRLLSSRNRVELSFFYLKFSSSLASVVLVLSTATYLACGLVCRSVGAQTVWRLAALRLVAGMLAAAHRLLAFQYLHQTARVESLRKSPQEYTGQLCGLVAAYLVAGTSFSPDGHFPLLWMACLAVLAHGPSLLLLVLLARRQHRRHGSSGAGDWGPLVDSSGKSIREDICSEVELMVEPRPAPCSSRGCEAEPDSAAAANVPGSTSNIGVIQTREVPRKQERIENVPARYLRGCQGNSAEAERRWRLTLEWRAREHIDEVLQEPQPHFDVIKRFYPHYIHKRARNGCPVWMELPGQFDLRAIRASGVSTEALRRHYIFVTEYLWNVVEPDFERGQAVTVLDVAGIGMRDLAGEALAFVKEATAIVQDHYVERSNRMFVINAPSYFSFIWRIVRPMLNERTQAKISIINTDKKKIAAALLECIPPENLPRQYGGDCSVGLGQSEEEEGLRAYVASLSSPGYGGKDRKGEVDLQKVESDRPQDARDGSAVASAIATDATASSPAARDSQDRETCTNDADGHRSGPARRAFGKVRQTLGWAGSKLKWRHAPVAHLGAANDFEYDPVQHQWVLRGGANDVQASAGKGHDGPGQVGHSQDGVVFDDSQSTREGHRRPPRARSSSVESSASEEMTVLAIQAAHQAQVASAAKFNLQSGEMTPVRRGVRGGMRIIHKPEEVRVIESKPSPTDTGGEHEFSGNFAVSPNGSGRCAQLISGSPCSSTGTDVTRDSPLTFTNLVYAGTSAIREALPVWLVSVTERGGLGVSSQLAGIVFAAGTLLGEVGRSAVASDWMGGGGDRNSSGWSHSLPVSALRHVVRARLASVAVLGVLYLLSRLWPGFSRTVGPLLLMMTVTAVVAGDYAALDLCSSRPRRASTSDGRGGSRESLDSEQDGQSVSGEAGCGDVWSVGKVSAPMNATGFEGQSLLAGDVLGSAGGPLALAAMLCTTLSCPFDSCSWMVLSLCLDSWLVLRSGRAEAQHTRLPNAEQSDFTNDARASALSGVLL